MGVLYLCEPFSYLLLIDIYRYHSCALFSNGRLLCWGCYTYSVGQLGTVYAQVQAIAYCLSASCVSVSSASFISFSDNTVPIKNVSCADENTCVLFENGRTLCFGSGTYGELGTSGNYNIAGATGSVLSSQPYMNFSNTERFQAISNIEYHTCVLRCDGAVLCFGINGQGELGRGNTSQYGDLANQMTTMQPISFDPAKITIPVPGCKAIITTLTENTGALLGFNPLITFYLFSVPGSVVSFQITGFSTTPILAHITINEGEKRSIVPLSFHHVTKVYISYQYRYYFKT